MEFQQQQQQVFRRRRPPALSARARRCCAFPGGQRREGGRRRSLPPKGRGLRPRRVPRHGRQRLQRPPRTGGPCPGKKPRAQRDRWQLPSELKPLGELRSGRRRGSRGEAEKNLVAITKAIGHSEISDSSASADGSARSRAVCAGSRAAVGKHRMRQPSLGGSAGHPRATRKDRGSYQSSCNLPSSFAVKTKAK